MKQTVGSVAGFGLVATVLVLAYLWLPYMILPIYAGLEKMPDSLLDASGDLGAKAGRTFRSVVLPLLDAVDRRRVHLHLLARLGDYIAVQIVGGKTQTDGQRDLPGLRRGNLPSGRGVRLRAGGHHGRAPARPSGGPARWRTSDAHLAARRG